MCKKTNRIFLLFWCNQKNLVSFLILGLTRAIVQSVQIIRHMQNSIYSVISLKEIVIYKNTPNMPRTYEYLEEVNVGIFCGLRWFFVETS
ncbi:hypothetical protein DFP77_104120 [Marinomonas foliarum]|jgi:hypothetical protein|uniref:Uncharacterized protein n=1 Tax=Marinomonas foliarum TaxID=491950 RepID=A0A369AHX9_9GAMM|nr:hypothetical protein DFP77_104120 [Marinomonas foliarum]